MHTETETKAPVAPKPAIDIAEFKREVTAFNKQQVDHMNLVKSLVLTFCTGLMARVLDHDNTKFDEEEYWSFVESRLSLNSSNDGRDAEYQKHFNSASIQRHVTINPHHPEYWDLRNQTMPIQEAIIMFYDWYSRSVQRHTSMDDFWQYNTDKLKNQPEALALVNYLKKLVEGRQASL